MVQLCKLLSAHIPATVVLEWILKLVGVWMHPRTCVARNLRSKLVVEYTNIYHLRVQASKRVSRVVLKQNPGDLGAGGEQLCVALYT